MIELTEKPLHAPGTSPFHSKGTTYIGHIQWVGEKFPGGRDAYLDALGFDPAVKTFHCQKFLAPTWYDFMPLACAGVTCAKAMHMSFEEFIAYRARYQAALDMRGVYKLLLTMTPSSFIAKKLARIFAQYFDFGEPVLREESKGYVGCEVLSVPTIFVPWMRACLTGFIEVVLATGGAKQVRVKSAHRPTDAIFKGYPTSAVQIEISWSVTG